ncbi:MAG: transporter [Xanthomonadales bacterium]|nr:transporter [Gammaproteobacteria bacterium]NNJ78552.1 transporter [Xanthomonadales bacterium]NNL04740.1 transporter [Xanthomonadales bacterium]
MSPLSLRRVVLLALVMVAAVAGPSAVFGQDIEPRRWTPMPTGLNVVGLGTSYTTGDIFFNPVLELDDVETEIAGGALMYMRSFGIAGKSARLDVKLPYASGRWSGLLSGEPAKTRRRGFADPRLRFSVLLYGSPALDRQAFASTPRSRTVVGAAVGVKLPWGEYFPEKLINLGSNRWTIRPQLGITHTRGRWTWEMTGSVIWYSDNDAFFGDSQLENDNLWTLQGHAIYTFKPGLWVSMSTAYGNGGDAFVDGEDKDLKVDNWLIALSAGIPINPQQGIKVSWIRTRTQNATGADLDNLSVGWSFMF